MAAVVPDAAPYLVVTDEMKLQKIEQIGEKVNRFCHHVEGFTLANMWNLGFRFDDLMKVTKVFMAETDDRRLELVFTEAVVARVVTSTRTVTLKMFVDLCRWMKSDECRKFLEKQARHDKLMKRQARRDKLMKRNSARSDPVGAAYAWALNEMCTDLAVKVKNVRADSNRKLVELRKQIKREEKELDSRIAELNAKFKPAC